MLRTLNLYGNLGERFGATHTFDADTPAQLLRAMCVQVEGFEEALRDGKYYRVMLGDIGHLEQGNLGLKFGDVTDLHVFPELEVAGIETIFIAGLALVAGVGLAVALMPTMRAPTPNELEREEREATSHFDGPVNVTQQGHVRPVNYGRVLSGSVVISSSYKSTRTQYSSLPPGSVTTPGFSSGGDGPGDNPLGDDLVLSKGGKQQAPRAPSESPNTLRSKTTARIVELLGEGECGGLVDGLKSVFLDGTPVQNADGSFNYRGISVVERTGTPDQTPVAGFTTAENPRTINREVRQDTGAVVETISDALVDVARVTIRINNLSRQDPDTGDLIETQLAYAIDLQTDGGGYAEVVRVELDDKTTSAYFEDHEIALPSGSVHNIRVRRLTADSEDVTIQDDMFFDTLTEVIEARLSYPNCHYVAVTAEAEQFGASIPARSYEILGRLVDVPTNLNTATGEYEGLWNGTFKKAWTDDGAWCVWDMITHNRYGVGRYVDPASIDKYGFYSIAQNNIQAVADGVGGTERRYTMNVSITARRKALALLAEMLSNFRSLAYWSESSIKLVQDAPRSAKKNVNQTNVVDGEFIYSDGSFDDLFSAVVVWWNNPDEGYRLVPEVVENRALIKRLGWKPKELTGFGVSRRGHAQRLGALLLEDQEIQLDSLKYRASYDQLDVEPGWVIAQTDPSRTTQAIGGRVKTPGTASVVLDRDVTIGAGDYTLALLMPDGSLVSRPVTTAAGTTDTLTVSPAFPATCLPGAVWNLASDTVAPRTWEVRGLKEAEEGVVEITCVGYDGTKYARVEDGVYVDATPWSDLPSGPLPAPEAVNVTAFLRRVENNAVEPSLELSWRPVRDPRVILYQAQVRLASGRYEDLTEGERVTRTLLNATFGTYVFRVRSVGAGNTYSPWRVSDDFVLEQSTFELLPPDAADWSVSGGTVGGSGEAQQPAIFAAGSDLPSGVTGIWLQYKRGASEYQTWFKDTPLGTTYTLTGLEAAKADYYVRIAYRSPLGVWTPVEDRLIVGPLTVGGLTAGTSILESAELADARDATAAGKESLAEAIGSASEAHSGIAGLTIEDAVKRGWKVVRQTGSENLILLSGAEDGTDLWRDVQEDARSTLLTGTSWRAHYSYRTAEAADEALTSVLVDEAGNPATFPWSETGRGMVAVHYALDGAAVFPRVRVRAYDEAGNALGSIVLAEALSAGRVGGFIEPRGKAPLLGPELAVQPEWVSPRIVDVGGLSWQVYTFATVEAGKAYQVSFDVVDYAGVQPLGLTGPSQTRLGLTVFDGVGSADFDFSAAVTAATSGGVSFYTRGSLVSGPNEATFTNISVREILTPTDELPEGTRRIGLEFEALSDDAGEMAYELSRPLLARATPADTAVPTWQPSDKQSVQRIIERAFTDFETARTATVTEANTTNGQFRAALAQQAADGLAQIILAATAAVGADTLAEALFSLKTTSETNANGITTLSEALSTVSGTVSGLQAVSTILQSAFIDTTVTPNVAKAVITLLAEAAGGLPNYLTMTTADGGRVAIVSPDIVLGEPDDEGGIKVALRLIDDLIYAMQEIRMSADGAYTIFEGLVPVQVFGKDPTTGKRGLFIRKNNGDPLLIINQNDQVFQLYPEMAIEGFGGIEQAATLGRASMMKAGIPNTSPVLADFETREVTTLGSPNEPIPRVAGTKVQVRFFYEFEATADIFDWFYWRVDIFRRVSVSGPPANENVYTGNRLWNVSQSTGGSSGNASANAYPITFSETIEIFDTLPTTAPGTGVNYLAVLTPIASPGGATTPVEGFNKATTRIFDVKQRTLLATAPRPGIFI